MPARTPLKILSVCGFESWWGTDLPPNVLDLSTGKTVGGGEEAALRTAVGLRELGHDVLFYWYGLPGSWRGVKFKSLQDDLYFTLQSQPWDVVLGWSTIRPLEWAPKGATRIFCQQLNDLLQQGAWDRVDCIASPSESHAKQLPGWGWRGKPYAVVHNGLDAELYGGVKRWGAVPDCIPPAWCDRPMDVGYWSSPDRGLHHLLRAWPAIRKAVPSARLHVFYELDRYIKIAVHAPFSIGDRGRLLDRILPSAYADPSIIFHGAVPRNELRRTQFQCRVMCYPYVPGAGYCEGFCFPPGTMVNTINGNKPVEKLSLSDKVQGKLDWRAITALKTRMFEGKMIRINPACGEAVEMTDDHPVYISEDGKSFDWLHADKVKPGMWLYSATPGREFPEVQPHVQVVEVPRRVLHPAHVGGAPANFGGKPAIELPPTLPVSAELCRLVGYFTGDGNAPNRGRTSSTASLFFGTEQKAAFVDDAVGCIKKVFGAEAKTSPHATKKMTTVQLQSAAVAYVLGSWCYAEDGKRRLPEWAMNLSLPFTGELLKGLWRTDGSVVEQDGARFAGFTSSSPYLIAQVRTLLARVGRCVRILQRTHKTGKLSWSMYFSIAGNFLDYGSAQREERMYHFYARPLSDGAFALRVREVTERPYKGLVHALTVDVDESHHVGNFLVHNCGSVNQGIAAGCHVLTCQQDALPSLYNGAVTWLPKEPEQLDAVLASTVTRALTDTEWSEQAVRRAEPHRFNFTWERAAHEIEAACFKENWKLTAKEPLD